MKTSVKFLLSFSLVMYWFCHTSEHNPFNDRFALPVEVAGFNTDYDCFNCSGVGVFSVNLPNGGVLGYGREETQYQTYIIDYKEFQIPLDTILLPEGEPLPLIEGLTKGVYQKDYFTKFDHGKALKRLNKSINTFGYQANLNSLGEAKVGIFTDDKTDTLYLDLEYNFITDEYGIICDEEGLQVAAFYHHDNPNQKESPSLISNMLVHLGFGSISCRDPGGE